MRLPRLVVLGALALSLAALIPALGPFMHESDQASLLHGAVELARGSASPFAADFYNYDKQFGTYWLLAVLHRAAPGVDLVTLGNVTAFIVFWGALTLVAGRARGLRLEAAIAMSTCILAPTLWMHSAFLATAFVSGGFLLLAWTTWKRSRLLSLALLAVAVAARADAILVLPWFAWTVLPAAPIGRLLRRPALYAIGFVGLAPLVAGRLMFTGDGVDLHAAFFYWKLFTAFTVFGLGATTIALVRVGASLLCVARRRSGRRRGHAAFYALGLPALLLPFLYYAPQFFSPRYWAPLLVALIGGLGTARLSRVLALPEANRIRAPLLITVGALALLPVFVGVHLPFPSRPRPVLAEATRFPTPDGLQPMGAMWSYLRAFATNPDFVADHNQATWLAARSATFEVDSSQRVPVLDFSLRSYVQLAAALHGLRTHVVTAEAPVFYADARDLLRIYHTPHRYETADRFALAAHLGLREAGPVVNGCVIVRAEPGGPPTAAWRERLLLARAASGNELRRRDGLTATGEFALSRRDEGKTVLLFARKSFAAEIVRPGGATEPISVVRLGEGRARTSLRAEETAANGVAALPDNAPLYVGRVSGAAWFGGIFRITQGTPAVAVTVHPDYMSTDRL